MQDTSVLVALIIAIVALVVAVAQLTQQIMATAYVIRKCDRIVTGGLTKGGIRQWHWRQFRFTVKYRAIVFALPASIYSALGVSPTVQVDTPSPEVWHKANKLREARTSSQGCWISFVQDLVIFTCLRPEDVCVKEESGDRIPEDLTVAPTRVDTITVMLTCIAMGMQVSRYSPTTGEITMAGGVGGVSSSVHPVLGCLLHYSIFSNEPAIGFETARRHGHALRQEHGVWANTVFGRFMDRSYRPEMTTLAVLRSLKLAVLQAQGWPENSYNDTIGGAACFMAFAHVDAYEAVPPSVVRPWCAHFAECIVKAHHVEIIEKKMHPKDAFILPPEFSSRRDSFIERHGCSSPHLRWETINDRTESSSEKLTPGPPVSDNLLRHLESKDVLAVHSLIIDLNTNWPRPSSVNIALDESDPSVYVSMATAWEIIMQADQCMRHIYVKCDAVIKPQFPRLVDEIVATAISSLSEVGAPSWGVLVSSQIINSFWRETFPAACNKMLTAAMLPIDHGHNLWISTYARLTILRAAYYTIMMRAVREIGPGLTEESRIDTALAYMA
ncbi:MAG: hypothetical protein ASARMPRED_002680 [Alectoria sarmentosa]|nr:MAG: hypothetical protein ASARMPRED_002680 [Alectoria sarmentosa]